MDVRKYFDYNPELELTVAQIGINKWDWESTTKFDETYAKRIMALNRFDILPVSIEGKISHYYQTDIWGDYLRVEVKEITKDDLIYYRLSFIDLIRRMINENRYHYFLSDSNDVLGLVSLNNLNCLSVYNYIYQVTASLEQLVSNYLKYTFKEASILKWLKSTSDKQANAVVEEYEILKAENTDNSIFHHLYFPTLGTLLKSAESRLKEENPELLMYRIKFCSGNLYAEIRNRVSHPVKPLFIDEQSVKKVNEMISDYIEIRKILSI